MMEKLVPTNGSDNIKGVCQSKWWGREECTLSDLFVLCNIDHSHDFVGTQKADHVRMS
jgi:hypothetical protein